MSEEAKRRLMYPIRITNPAMADMADRLIEGIAATPTFDAKHLTREQVERGYQQILQAIDTKRLETWATFVMETEPAAKKEIGKRYRQMGREYEALAADFAAWSAANPLADEE